MTALPWSGSLPVVMLGELTYSRDVAALRPCGEPPQLHILQHPLSQTGHDDLLPERWQPLWREIVFVVSVGSTRKCV